MVVFVLKYVFVFDNVIGDGDFGWCYVVVVGVSVVIYVVEIDVKYVGVYV